MDIVAVDPGNVRIRHYNEWEVSKGLDAVREADGKEGEGEISGGEESFGRQRRPAMSACYQLLNRVTERQGRPHRTRSASARGCCGRAASLATWSSWMLPNWWGQGWLVVEELVVEVEVAYLLDPPFKGQKIRIKRD